MITDVLQIISPATLEPRDLVLIVFYMMLQTPRVCRIGRISFRPRTPPKRRITDGTRSAWVAGPPVRASRRTTPLATASRPTARTTTEPPRNAGTIGAAHRTTAPTVGRRTT